MTYAQKLKKIGQKEAKQEERFSIAKKMFQEGITASVIKKITGFNEEALDKLLQTSL